MTSKKIQIAIVLSLIASLVLTTGAFAGGPPCNPNANEGSAAAEACVENPPSGEGETNNGDNGLHIGQQAKEAGVNAGDLVKEIKDSGVDGLGENKDETQAAIDEFVAPLEQSTTSAPPLTNEIVDPASVQIGWNLPNGQGTAFGHVYWMLCMNTGRGWKPWNPDVDAGKPNLERLIGILEHFGTRVAPEPEGGCGLLP